MSFNLNSLLNEVQQEITLIKLVHEIKAQSCNLNLQPRSSNVIQEVEIQVEPTNILSSQMELSQDNSRENKVKVSLCLSSEVFMFMSPYALSNDEDQAQFKSLMPFIYVAMIMNMDLLIHLHYDSMVQLVGALAKNVQKAFKFLQYLMDLDQQNFMENFILYSCQERFVIRIISQILQEVSFFLLKEFYIFLLMITQDLMLFMTLDAQVIMVFICNYEL